MSYRITANGMIECDSIQEAAQAAKFISAQIASPPARRVKAANSNRPDSPGIAKGRRRAAKASEAIDPEALYESLKPDQRKLLDYLKEHQQATLEDLRTGLKLKGKYQLSGLLSGLQRTMKRLGVKPTDVFTREQAGKGPAMVITYRSGPALKHAA